MDKRFTGLYCLNTTIEVEKDWRLGAMNATIFHFVLATGLMVEINYFFPLGAVILCCVYVRITLEACKT